MAVACGVVSASADNRMGCLHLALETFFRILTILYCTILYYTIVHCSIVMLRRRSFRDCRIASLPSQKGFHRQSPSCPDISWERYVILMLCISMLLVLL